MSRFLSTILAFVVLAFAFLILPPRLSAQCCHPGEIVVGEDANNCYCIPKTQYAACVKRAGEKLRASKPACARVFNQCLVDQRPGLTTAGLSCVLGCLGSDLSPKKCLAACGAPAVYYENVLDKCVDQGNVCFGDALQKHRKNVEACKQ